MLELTSADGAQTINWGRKHVTTLVPKFVDKHMQGAYICQDQDHLVVFPSNLEKNRGENVIF